MIFSVCVCVRVCVHLCSCECVCVCGYSLDCLYLDVCLFGCLFDPLFLFFC